MHITNWNPFRELDDVLSRYHSWPITKNNNGELTTSDWTPKVDIKEDKDAYFVDAELPGVKREDVKITLKKGILSISGEKQFEKKSDDEKSHRVERAYGSFLRSFSLPESVKEDAVVAKFKDGLLHLVIPKADEKLHKTIEIQVD